MKSLQDTYQLHNGYHIPCIGFGTWRTPDGDVCIQSVLQALRAGYRHIDTAYIYGNEVSVGKAILLSGIDRSEVFITSKLWNTDRGYDKTIQAFNRTLKNLQLDYLDLYLIHWPANQKQFNNYETINKDTWQALVDLYKQGKIKAIGVSNFKVHHLLPLLQFDVIPMVNQIEFHPGLLQEEIVSLCQKNNILIQAWSPLGSGRLLENEILKTIADKYQKSVAQICIKWCLNHQTNPLPKSVTPSRIIENSQVFDFELHADDIKKINQLSDVGGSQLDSDFVDF